MMSQIVSPITAKQFRTGRFNSPFNIHIGINNIEGFNSPKGRCAITATPPETATNIYKGVGHGGWTATFLDTVASCAAYTDQSGGLEDNEFALTKSIDIKFKKPVLIGQPYTGSGKIIRRTGNDIETEATVIDSKGVEVASATAVIKARRPDYTNPNSPATL